MSNIVLIVDDNLTQTFLLKLYLSKYVNVMVANDGLDGYSKISSMIKEGNVDAIKFIITDIQMPNLDDLVLQNY